MTRLNGLNSLNSLNRRMGFAHRWLLLAAIPGLMFFVIPIHGMEFRFSWQLAAIWLGGLAFAALLSSWWWRGFWLLALIRTATILPPVMEGYISLLLMAVFLAAAEGFSRINPDRVMDSMCVAATGLLVWMGLQKLGIATVYYGTGPFNPDIGGILLALCLPATFRPRWWLLIPAILWGLVIAATTTGILAAAAGAIAFLYNHLGKKGVVPVLILIVLGLGIWVWKIDPLETTLKNSRWTAWRHAALSFRSEVWGRGLGSWETIFPLLTSGSGNPALGTVENDGKKLVMNNVFCQAHNEYAQTAFELGLQTLLLILSFVVLVIISTLAGLAPKHAAAGVIALFVACFGIFAMHVAPTALLGCAWLGMWRRGDK